MCKSKENEKCPFCQHDLIPVYTQEDGTYKAVTCGNTNCAMGSIMSLEVWNNPAYKKLFPMHLEGSFKDFDVLNNEPGRVIEFGPVECGDCGQPVNLPGIHTCKPSYAELRKLVEMYQALDGRS